RKREERNRKQREYYARRKADETTEERETRNKRMRDYRAWKKAETAPGGDNTHVAQAETPYGTSCLLQTPCSTISQASRLQYMDSIGPSDPMDEYGDEICSTPVKMGTRRQTALTDISNQIITGPTDEHERHREERDRKQREYRARRKLKKPTKKGRREIKELLYSLRQTQAYATGSSIVIQTTTTGDDNRKVAEPVTPDATTASTMGNLIMNRARYINMDDADKEIRLHKRREYKKFRQCGQDDTIIGLPWLSTLPDTLSGAPLSIHTQQHIVHDTPTHESELTEYDTVLIEPTQPSLEGH
ncbi:hypothetical protein ACJX0J_042387, partial [Zea mays]